jgi:hypothetical protein
MSPDELCDRPTQGNIGDNRPYIRQAHRHQNMTPESERVLEGDASIEGELGENLHFTF